MEQLLELIGALDPDNTSDGLKVLHALEDHFGFSGSVFTRDDIWVSVQERKADYADEEQPLTDEIIEKVVVAVMDSRYWTRALSDSMTEDGWNTISLAVDDVIDDVIEKHLEETEQ